MPCRTCATGNTSFCTSCYTNTTITSYVYYYIFHATCYQTCPTGTYANISVMQCLACNSSCATCFDADNCTSCVSNSTYSYLFFNNSLGFCLTTCPSFYYPTGTNPVCVPCVSPCITCISLTQCTSCLVGFYLYNYSCLIACPSVITITNSITNTCDSCNAVCATCLGTVDNCTTCSIMAAFYNGTCVAECPAPLVIDNGSCYTDCSPNCLTCSIRYNNCTSCNASSI